MTIERYNVFAQNILTLFNKAGRNLTIDEKKKIVEMKIGA